MKIFPVLFAFILTSCSSQHTPPPQQSRGVLGQNVVKKITLNTAYDYQLLNSQYQPISLAQLAQSIKGVDVVFVGEYHGNHASHLLEMQLLAALFEYNKVKKRSMVLSLEMFNRDQQKIVNDYMDGKIGERYLIEKTPSWSNYKASYRPLVEFAKQHQLSVIAANASGDIIRCIGRQGKTYYEKLDQKEKQLIANKPFAEVVGYADKFFGFMSSSNHLPSSRQKNSYLAQLTRDNTMAESIYKSFLESPKSQIIHMNGSFHSENYLGTVGALKRMMPNLKVKVITPVHKTKLIEHKKKNNKDDFYYVINKQPKEFISKAFMQETYKNMFAKSKKKSESCK